MINIISQKISATALCGNRIFRFAFAPILSYISSPTMSNSTALSVVPDHFSQDSNCIVTNAMLLCHSRKELMWEIKSPSKNLRFLRTVTNQEN